MALPTVSGSDIPASDESLCSLDGAEAEGRAIGRIDRDLFVFGRHFNCCIEGNEFRERPVARLSSSVLLRPASRKMQTTIQQLPFSQDDRGNQ